MKPRIFISHSTKTKEAERFLASVTSGLEAEYEILLDKDGLQSGDDWRRKLYRWMDEAHGAILLLTREALASNFVPIEASVLSWRRYRDPNFAFVPVLVDDSSIDDFKTGVLGALALDVFQIQKAELRTLDATIEEIRAALCQFRVKFPHPKTPMERLQFLLCKHIEGAEIDSLSLEEIGQKAFSWIGHASGKREALMLAFVCSLLESDRDSAMTALLALAETLVAKVPPILAAVAPTWIEQERASPIAETVLESRARRQLMLDTDERLIADLYICRACCRPFPPTRPWCQIIPIKAPSRQNTLEDICDQIMAELAPRRATFSAPDLTRIKRRLVQADRRNMPVLLLFDPDFIPDPELISDLRAEFPSLTFFVLTRRADKQMVSLLRPVVRELVGLGLEEEQSIVDDFDNLY